MADGVDRRTLGSGSQLEQFCLPGDIFGLSRLGVLGGECYPHPLDPSGVRFLIFNKGYWED